MEKARESDQNCFCLCAPKRTEKGKGAGQNPRKRRKQRNKMIRRCKKKMVAVNDAD